MVKLAHVSFSGNSTGLLIYLFDYLSGSSGSSPSWGRDKTYAPERAQAIWCRQAQAICYRPLDRPSVTRLISYDMLFAGHRPRAVLKTLGTVFPNTDRPRPANNVFIFFSLEITL